MPMVLGIDPGPTPGVVLLLIQDRQVVGVEKYAAEFVEACMLQVSLVAMERFILGRGTVRRTRAGSQETLAQVEQIRGMAQRHGVRLVEFPAGTVKPWATDDRLRAFGCYVTGDHHRDAARHALFAAVRSGLLPRRPVDNGNAGG